MLTLQFTVWYNFTGRGVFTTIERQQGDFLLLYRGSLLKDDRGNDWRWHICLRNRCEGKNFMVSKKLVIYATYWISVSLMTCETVWFWLTYYIWRGNFRLPLVVFTDVGGGPFGVVWRQHKPFWLLFSIMSNVLPCGSKSKSSDCVLA